MDFSSAFNTVQSHLLLRRLRDLNVSGCMVLLIKEFLRDRPQKVRINNILSDTLVLNTGVPQGCVLSPLLFSIYRNEIQCNSSNLSLLKYADGMSLVACLQGTNSTSYCQYINTLASWFDCSFLDLNVAKTKELCLRGNRREGGKGSMLTFMPISMKGQDVEQVTHFKYLGTIIDDHLSFQENVD